jgi:hypothetical protein
MPANRALEECPAATLVRPDAEEETRAREFVVVMKFAYRCHEVCIQFGDR